MTLSAKFEIYATVLTCVNPGEEVLLPDPTDLLRGERHVRLSYTSPDEVLRERATRIRCFLARLPGRRGRAAPVTRMGPYVLAHRRPAVAPPLRVHDLTALLETHMPVWPTSPLPVFEPTGLVPRDGYSIERINCMSHTGTHMDAPYHFLEEGLTVDRIPPERLVGSAAVLDLREVLAGTKLERETLRARWPRSLHPEIVLLETGWSRARASTRKYLYDFPGLTPEAAAWAADQGIHGIGTDTLGIDPFDNVQYEAHKVLLKRGIWILEALDHLDELREGTLYTLVAAPLKISGGSGAMARVLAWEA